MDETTAYSPRGVPTSERQWACRYAGQAAVRGDSEGKAGWSSAGRTRAGRSHAGAGRSSFRGRRNPRGTGVTHQRSGREHGVPLAGSSRKRHVLSASLTGRFPSGAGKWKGGHRRLTSPVLRTRDRSVSPYLASPLMYSASRRRTFFLSSIGNFPRDSSSMQRSRSYPASLR